MSVETMPLECPCGATAEYPSDPAGNRRAYADGWSLKPRKTGPQHLCPRCTERYLAKAERERERRRLAGV